MIMAGMRAEARGSVTITSADPHQPPALRFNYLSTEADRRFWVDAVRTTRELLAQPAFREIDGGETYPGPAVESDQQILDWVTRTAETNMHPTSTCRMGTDDRSVLDPATMQVHGLEGDQCGRRVGHAALPEQRHACAHDDARGEGLRPPPRQHPARPSGSRGTTGDQVGGAPPAVTWHRGTPRQPADPQMITLDHDLFGTPDSRALYVP